MLGSERKREWWAWYSVESIWWKQRRWPNWVIPSSQWHSSRNGISFWQARKIILHALWKKDLCVILWIIIRILLCKPNLHPFIYITTSLWCCPGDSYWGTPWLSGWFTQVILKSAQWWYILLHGLEKEEPKEIYLMHKNLGGWDSLSSYVAIGN